MIYVRRSSSSDHRQAPDKFFSPARRFLLQRKRTYAIFSLSMATPKIKFGTSGWRGVIADDFTFSRVRAVTQAIADHLAAQGLKDKGVVIGYDTRFHSERFALEAARVFAANGMR